MELSEVVMHANCNKLVIAKTADTLGLLISLEALEGFLPLALPLNWMFPRQIVSSASCWLSVLLEETLGVGVGACNAVTYYNGKELKA